MGVGVVGGTYIIQNSEKRLNIFANGAPSNGLVVFIIIFVVLMKKEYTQSIYQG